ncbi:MAG: L-glutamate gamma-semialdehyde dehydrogenase [Armatimonadota bacterium]|nr:L-glutamate gamma-semialdehyde dehydrogenase [Armatimonadota bacterium]MDR7452746.1 L-glutamate gamma-semialdehyde dehydrogenase [Armatimonadota bacterium]MDR7468288.1 L-glutamate gamma-semialdehyde dehydrogenase [Armatimonadota bacterium]MDR7495027.1 L-glutamate gamma-semialdehyde dehydrogenase [Armatimonadota bacterium]MDR7500463.1 L-glutamate gamma-semialdehyde dehydrogenase [Armatimonadota bacterium]
MALPEFRNEPFVDFSLDAHRSAMLTALTQVGSELGREFPLVIGGRRIAAPDKFRSMNPSRKDEVVAVCQKATPDHVQQAVAAAEEAFSRWSRVPAEERAAILLRAADRLRRRKFWAAAWQVYEVAKNWGEADADVAETIDHLEFFAREALRYAQGQRTAPHPQEFSEYAYLPLGVVAVIPPWNFPLAIPVGMASAAIAAGNTVVMKPSSDSPANAYVFLEVMEEAGLPPGVLNIITGSGASVGDPLVLHPRVRMVAFTGSKEVGIRLYEQTAKVSPGQIWLKRCIAEMGGKNAVIIDDEADLEEAVAAAVVSGYGFQGQKCSAGSRLVATAGVYKDVVEAFVEKVRALEQGPAKENYPSGPVINERAKQTILDYIRIGKSEGRLAAGGEPGDPSGHYIQPTVFVDVDPRARIAQEEIFGPVVAVIRAKDFDDALAIANGTEYGLTGAVFSRNPEKLARARREFFCGNLYLNRKCTGALVGVHPFGGFNMSGTDAKVGGPDYLLYFLQPKVVSIKHH